MPQETAEERSSMVDNAPEQAAPSMFLNGLPQRGPPATSVHTTNSPGVGTPVNEPAERPQFPRLNTSTTDPSSQDQDAGILMNTRRPALPQAEVNSTNEDSSGSRPFSYVDLPTPVSAGGFPVLVDYSAVLVPVSQATSPPASLITQYTAGDSMDAFRSRILAEIYLMGAAEVTVQTVAEQRARHMRLGIFWEGQSQPQGLSVPLEGHSFTNSMKLMFARNMRDKVVVLFDPCNVSVPVQGKSKGKGKEMEIAHGRKPSSAEPYLAGQLTEYKDDVLMYKD